MNSRQPQPRLQRRQAGITLVETATVTAVLAVAVGSAVPGFDRALQRHRLEGAAAQLETDIHYARSLAVARNMPLRIGFDNAAGCYVIHTGAAQQCSCKADGSAVCQGGAQAERSVAIAAGSKLGLRANVRSVLFDPVRGTSTPTATLRVESDHGMAIHQVLNVMGRVRSCAPAPGLSGYATC
jgi:type IV fimbrial biogenesis protein FimT